MQTKLAKFNGQELRVTFRDQVDQSVFAEIFSWREYRSVEPLIKSAQFPIIDGGAQAGFFTLYCRALNDKIRIYALEPEAENIKALVSHIKKNHLTNVKVVEKALAGQSGSREFYLYDDNHNHSLILPTKSIVSVATLSLSDFLKEFKLEQISLLKLDIEGAEYEVLNALKPDDWLKIENLIFEYHDWAGFNHQQLENLIRQNGFSVENFPSHFDKKLGFIFARNKRLK